MRQVCIEAFRRGDDPIGHYRRARNAGGAPLVAANGTGSFGGTKPMRRGCCAEEEKRGGASARARAARPGKPSMHRSLRTGSDNLVALIGRARQNRSSIDRPSIDWISARGAARKGEDLFCERRGRLDALRCRRKSRESSGHQRFCRSRRARRLRVSRAFSQRISPIQSRQAIAGFRLAPYRRHWRRIGPRPRESISVKRRDGRTGWTQAIRQCSR